MTNKDIIRHFRERVLLETVDGSTWVDNVQAEALQSAIKQLTRYDRFYDVLIKTYEKTSREDESISKSARMYLLIYLMKEINE